MKHLNSMGDASTPVYGLLAAVFVLPGTLLNLAAMVNARQRERRRLAALDPRLLRDVGLSRREACREAAKPFWKR